MGNDTSTCGTKDNPCETIAGAKVIKNQKEVCLKSGIYENSTIPHRMRWWKTEEEEGERPTLKCLNSVSVTSAGDLMWSGIHIQNCSGSISTVNIQIDSVLISSSILRSSRIFNTSITNSTFLSSFSLSVQFGEHDQGQHLFTLDNNRFLSATYDFMAISPSSTKSQVQISHNFLGPNTKMTTSLRSWTELNIINNTCGGISSRSSLWIDTIQSDDSRFNVLHNRLGYLSLAIKLIVMPNLIFEENFISRAVVTIQTTGDSLYTSRPKSQLNIIRNRIGSAQWLLQEEHTDASNSEEIGVNEEALSHNILNNNTIDSLEYSIQKTVIGLITHYDIRGNRFEQVTLLAASLNSDVLNLTENTFTRTNETFDALSISQIQGFTIAVADSNFENYDGAGIAFRDVIHSAIYVDRVNVSNCRNGGIRMNLYNSRAQITSCTVHNNTSPSDGGGIALFGDNAAVDISQSNLTQNFASHASCLMGSLGRDSSVQLRDVYMTVADNVTTTTDHSVVVLTSKYNTSQVNLQCTDGSFLDAREQEKHLLWSCSLCESGSYTLGRGMIVADNKTGTQCNKCPQGAICEVGKPVSSRGDFWCGATDGELRCHPCPNGYCRRDDHPWQQPCVGDRDGILCGGCKDETTLGFLTSFCLPTHKCKPQLLAVASLMPFLYSAVLMALPIGDGSIWKSTSYFIQTVPLLGRSFLGFCLGTFNYVQKEAFSLYLPFGTVLILCLVSLGLCVIDAIVKRRKGDARVMHIEWKKRSVISRSTAASVGALLLVYSGVVSSCLKLLFCVQPGVWVMYNDGTERCNQTWRTVLIAISSVTLILAPILILLLRRRLKRSEETVHRDVLIVLEGCYRPGRKYWESIYMGRRLMIAVAYVFITNEAWTQPVMHLLMITSLIAHLYLKPFVTKVGQNLETICLISLTVITLPISHGGLFIDVVIQILIAFPLIVSGSLMGKKLFVKLRGKWRKRCRKNELAEESEALLINISL
ncbi:hypothetical protein PROFUN_05214 [Planoprotostelium fungivorum]|uniref:Right handed beta helix domain-containing protein n=1 Tax=Planoprotostelium fungivorum TaxID=1890364 RepID=A0A2P6NRJ6_9EUKA|nr:hypothetical protein PROFUN_05214 [Planoprotostelium fungivorum]